MSRCQWEHGAMCSQGPAGAAVSEVTHCLTGLPRSFGEPQTPCPDGGSQGLSSSRFFTPP